MIDVKLLRRIWPVIAGTTVAMIPMETAPFLISAVVESSGITQAQAGWVGSASVGAVAVTSMIAAPALHRLPFRRTMGCCALLLILGYAGLIAAGSLWSVVLLAVIAGAGSGGLISGMAMLVAGLPDPDKAYGYIYASTGFAFALLLLLLPMADKSFGPGALFAVIAAAAALASLALAKLAAPAEGEEAGDGAAGQVRWGAAGLVALVMTIGFPLYGGIFGMAERKALEVGMTSVQAGATLSAATLLSIAGSMLVAVVGVRWGRVLPTVVVMLLATLAYYLTLGARDAGAFVPGLLMFGFMQLGLNSYFFGLASVLDRGGRIAAALQGYSLIPYALGPGLFVSLVGAGPLTQLAVPAVAVNIAALVILLPVLIAVDHRARARPALAEASA
ncbi:MAG TPA: MFS transporter [Phenylobacterium sp.]|uniref:MFS transporter n=1 Tax=Phenylobacterium sp. TaxID=1871053 RepID=UPI002B49A517|nr:MFS transporter [Phenylobacterium sp.]HKR87120.1 MFS transporter [Phenylobacterium sp.]